MDPYSSAPVCSPDGRYIVYLHADEMRMSHWILTPTLIDRTGECVLFSLDGTLWSADRVEWSADSRRLTLTLRRYPGDLPGVLAEIDLDQNRVTASHDGRVEQVPLARLRAWLEAIL